MKRVLFVFACFLFLTTGLRAQSWKENSGTEWNYSLAGIKILTVVYEGFNYDEAMDIGDYWKKWGAKVDIAGTLPEQHGERNNPATGTVHDEIPVTFKPDLLLSEVDYRQYDLVYFPGGEEVQEFLNTSRNELREIIDGTVSGRKYVAAICHSPLLLAASELLKGHSVTLQGDEFRPELIKSGAKIVNEVFVSDGYFLTGRWPYFETFAASVAEKLLYPNGNGPLETARKKNITLNRFLDQRNVYHMKPGTISDDTVRLIVNHSVNPVLPFEMMNNSFLRIVAVKDPGLKSQITYQLVEAGTEKFKSQNVSATALKRFWTTMMEAPVVMFIYADLPVSQSVSDNEVFRGIAFSLAGQSVAQMGAVARELGYAVSVLGGLRSLIAGEGIGKVLNIPENYRLVNIVGIGRPLEMANPPVIRPVDEYLTIR